MKFCNKCGRMMQSDNLGNWFCFCGNEVDEKDNVISEPENIEISPIQKHKTTKLIQCPDCNKDISPLAESCPNCGRPMSKQIRCPACKSMFVDKISGANKVGTALAFGVFSLGHISKTFKCKNCGYKW